MTAEDFLKSKEVVWETDRGTNVVNDFDCCKTMIEFAKLHVETALKEASISAETKEESGNPYDMDDKYYVVDKDSILNAYSLDNIK